MKNGGLAVDISLLAVLIALHATRKNKHLELVVMALLFSHVIMTTEAFHMYEVNGVNDEELDDEELDEELDEVVVDEVVVDEAGDEIDNNNLGSNLGNPGKNRKSVSDSEFDRMAFVPSANVELAKARSSFFEELFKNPNK